MTRLHGFAPMLVALSVMAAGKHAVAQTRYAAFLDASQVVNNPSDSTATGSAFFQLNATGDSLSYAVDLYGLDLEPVPDNRTDHNDVVGIHIHLHVPSVIGPHILNIFGNPSEDDADLIADYDHESLSGVFDLDDASRDPDTGEILEQFFPLTTKIITDWTDELAAGELYIAVHTVGASVNLPGVAIRGNIYPIPEPATVGGCILAFAIVSVRRPTRRI